MSEVLIWDFGGNSEHGECRMNPEASRETRNLIPIAIGMNYEIDLLKKD